MSSSPASAPSDGAHGRKAVLFCQDCGYASPVDGDWHVRSVGRHRRTRCPECRSVVDERRIDERPRARHRPRSARDGVDSSIRRVVNTWERCWSAWTSFVVGG